MALSLEKGRAFKSKGFTFDRKVECTVATEPYI